jgi:hypothetical protein
MLPGLVASLTRFHTQLCPRAPFALILFPAPSLPSAHSGATVELQQIYQHEFVEISVDRKRNWLYANWKGYQSDACIKEGCELMLTAMKEFKAVHILNDNRQVLGIWTGVADWLARNWFPRMRASGMKKFALIYSPSRFSQISADAAMLLYDQEGRDVVGFHSESAAVAWLAQSDEP